MRVVAGRRRISHFKAGVSTFAITLLATLGLLVTFALPASAADSVTKIGAFGPDGTASTEFDRPAGLAIDQETGAVYVYDSEAEVLYKFDEEGSPLDWGGSAGYISGNEVTGVAPNPNPNQGQVAVDPETHVVYVTSANKIRAFEANGEPHVFAEGPGAGTDQIPGATELLGLAVDAFGSVYASDFSAQKVRIYSRSGALITEFEPIGNQLSPLNPRNLAVAPDGTLYVVHSGFGPGVYALEPSEFPVTEKTTYGLGQPSQKSASSPQSVAVDPATEYVYIGENCDPGLCQSPSASQISVYDENGDFLTLIGVEEAGGPGELIGSVLGLAANGNGKKLYAAVLGEGGGLSQVAVYESIAFPEGPPTVSGTSATAVGLSSAKLRGKINPNTFDTTYRFEYGTEDCAVSVCASIPVPDAAIGDGHEDVVVSQDISGLQPGTTYHYRVVAENAEGPTETPDKTFTTETADLGFSLTDSRAWEMVSPPEKFGARVFHTGEGTLQAAADGNGVAYMSYISLEADPEGNRAVNGSTVLSRRGAGGSWSSEDLSPPYQEVTPLRFGGEYKALSPDLGRALLEQQDATPLSPEASEETPYLRENTDPPRYTPLVTGKEPYANVPPGTVFGGGNGSGASLVAIRAANADLSYVVLRSKAPLVAGAEAFSLYLWHAGTLEPVSELPEGGKVVGAQPGSNLISTRHAISEDGSRVFWSLGAGFAPTVELTGLYLRDTIMEKTFRIDLSKPGASEEGAHNPAFMAASADGSVVFFTDSQQLTADASPKGRDLYRCEIGNVGGGALGCTELEDLSVPLQAGEIGEAQELALGVSKDGSRAYFVAGGVLDEAPNAVGGSAVPGGPNLYLWQEGQGDRFIAHLSQDDKADWGEPAGDNTGRGTRATADSSPNGRYLTFMSQDSLTGYENADAKSFEPTAEVFRYDALNDELVCVSCNPTGASPEGEVLTPTSQSPLADVDPRQSWAQHWVAATVPEAQESEAGGLAFRRPRATLDNGRVFFNAIDALVSADSNGEWDVYQWEPTGVGDCTASSGGAAVARSAGGCVSLVSSGTGTEEASFLDASESGDDVFFFTPAQLSVTDEDQEVDVYDARVNGIPATRTPNPECLGEACQPAASAPNDPTPASAAFSGPGNVRPKPHRCAKGKRAVQRKGKTRCVVRHPKKHRAHGNRRTQR